MALAIVNASSGNPGTGASFTTTYTNASACVMILHVVTRCGSAGFSAVSSITDSAGITWTRRKQVQFISTNFNGINACNHMTHEIWWANITAVHASAVTITINLANDTNQVTSTLYNQFQVTGSLVPATPWDINGGASATATYTNASVNTDPTTNWSVSSSAALVLEFLSENGATGSTAISTQGTGYSLVTGIQIGTSGTGISHQAVASKAGSSGSGTATWTSVANIREWVNVTDALTSDSNGTAGAAGSVSGTITTNLTKASLSAVAKETFTGTIVTRLTKASIAAMAATEIFTGTITTNLTKASIAAAAKEIFTGTINTALTKISQAVSGKETVTGTATTNLSKISQLLTGTGPSAGVTGTVTMRLSGIAQHATDVEIFTGTITTNLAGIAQSAIVATEIIVGTVVTRLTRANFSVAAEERVIGIAVTRLNSAFGQTIANVVQAEVIVLGPIIMALPPFRSVVLGAQLGPPGAGKWYSWRYTDS
jgi:hypothetical protein